MREDDLIGVNLYNSDIESFEEMTEDERIVLFKRMENGDASAKEELITRNLRLVRYIANDYVHQHYNNYLDVIQAGSFGLIKAVEEFDYKKGKKFSTYARHWIKHFIIRYFQNDSRTIRIPVHAQEDYYKIINVKEKIRKETGECCDLKEVSRLSKIPFSKVKEYEEMVVETTSLNKNIDYKNEESEELMNLIVDDNEFDILQKILNDELLKGCLKQVYNMTPNQKFVAVHYYFADTLGVKPMNLPEIAGKLGVTSQRAGQLKIVVEKKLKKFIEEYKKGDLYSKKQFEGETDEQKLKIL